MTLRRDRLVVARADQCVKGVLCGVQQSNCFSVGTQWLRTPSHIAQAIEFQIDIIRMQMRHRNLLVPVAHDI